jgi:hypothetical protein
MSQSSTRQRVLSLTSHNLRKSLLSPAVHTGLLAAPICLHFVVPAGTVTPTVPAPGRSAFSTGGRTMSIASLTESALPPADRAFVAVLPRIDNALRFAFRRLPQHRREEAVAEGRDAD